MLLASRIPALSYLTSEPRRARASFGRPDERASRGGAEKLGGGEKIAL